MGAAKKLARLIRSDQGITNPNQNVSAGQAHTDANVAAIKRKRKQAKN